MQDSKHISLTRGSYRKDDVQSNVANAVSSPLRKIFYQPEIFAEVGYRPTNEHLNPGDQDGSLTFAQKAVILLFVVGIFSPIAFYLGPLRFSPNRLVLFLSIIPAVFMLFGGRLGKILPSDWLMILLGLWILLSMTLRYGASLAIEPAGYQLLELTGSYFLARALIVSRQSLVFFCKVFVLFVVLCAPFAVYDSITYRHLILDSLRPLFVVHANVNYPGRLGLQRAQGPFEHPILFGIVVSLAVGLSMASWRKPGLGFKGVSALASVMFTTFFSLSSGAFLSVLFQLALHAWDRLLRVYRYRWRVFVGLVATMYVAVDIISNRTPFEVFTSRFAFDGGTAYMRVLQWHYGVLNMYKHPFLGVGYFGDWERADWMPGSVDNYWLGFSLRFGLPATFMVLAVLFLTIFKLSRQPLPKECAQARAGLLIAIGGFSIAICTVYIWSVSQSIYFFLLGCCQFFIAGKFDNADRQRLN